MNTNPSKGEIISPILIARPSPKISIDQNKFNKIINETKQNKLID